MVTHNNPCLICARHNRKTTTTGYACPTCTRQLHKTLTRITTLTDAAANWTPTPTTGGGNSNKPASRPPLDLTALDDAWGHDTLPILEAWQRIIRNDYNLTPYGEATADQAVTVATATRFLHQWVDELARTWPVIDELALELDDLSRRLSRYDETRDPNGWRIACPGLTDELTNCGHHITIHGELNDNLTCPACHTTWTTTRLIRVATVTTKTTPTWLDADTAATLTGWTTRHLRRLADQGKLTRTQGRYLLDELQARTMSAPTVYRAR